MMMPSIINQSIINNNTATTTSVTVGGSIDRGGQECDHPQRLDSGAIGMVLRVSLVLEVVTVVFHTTTFDDDDRDHNNLSQQQQQQQQSVQLHHTIHLPPRLINLIRPATTTEDDRPNIDPSFSSLVRLAAA